MLQPDRLGKVAVVAGVILIFISVMAAILIYDAASEISKETAFCIDEYQHCAKPTDAWVIRIRENDDLSKCRGTKNFLSR